MLEKREAQQLDFLFDTLNTVDSAVLDAIGSVTGWLRNEARDTLDMVDLDNLIGANKCI